MLSLSKAYPFYWYVAVERQNIFLNKLHRTAPGSHVPYSNDPIFQEYKFCNTYRASDRVSQFLIKEVIYGKREFSPIDQLFRIILFRLLNKCDTWIDLETKLGEISWSNYNFDSYSRAFEAIKSEKGVVYGNAFILCATKAFGYDKKYQNHLGLLEYIFKSDIYREILEAKNLKQLFERLRTLPLIGDFMAYQIAIDLNYSELFEFSENDFTIAGPGALRGIKKCFTDTSKKSSEYIIQHMVENQDREFERLGLEFQNLFGRKLHAIDCQNLFCETDKYLRVKMPELASNRTQIKAKYKPVSNPDGGVIISKITLFYPPKWKLEIK